IEELQTQKRTREEQEFHITNATQCLECGDLVEADRHLREAKTRGAGDSRLQELGRRLEEAKDEKRKRVELHALLEQGEKAFDAGDWNEAAENAREVLRRNPGNVAAFDLLKRADEAKRRKRREQAAPLLVEAERAFAESDLATAQARAEEALRVDPQ